MRLAVFLGDVKVEPSQEAFCVNPPNKYTARASHAAECHPLAGRMAGCTRHSGTAYEQHHMQLSRPTQLPITRVTVEKWCGEGYCSLEDDSERYRLLVRTSESCRRILYADPVLNRVSFKK
jgi:hypothetical protein